MPMICIASITLIKVLIQVISCRFIYMVNYV